VIAETCSCGAKFKTDDAQAVKLVREWRRRHTCQTDNTDNTDNTDIVEAVNGGVSDNQIAIGFQPGEIPAKEYDPWDD
jgi:hypothetical protein